MARGYKDHVANSAVGHVDSEWKNMARLALRIREGRHNDPYWEEEQEAKFTGIYKRLLTDPLDFVRHEAGGRG